MSGGPWHNLIGTVKQYAGSSGTVTLGAGECVLLVVAHASAGGATVSILGGAAIPVVSGAPPTTIAMLHTLLQANAVASTVVFTGTDAYYVQSVKQGNT